MKRAALFLILLMLLCGCAPKGAERQIYTMDTVADMCAWGDCAEAALDAVEEMLVRVEAAASPSDPESEVNRLNAAGSEGIVPSEDLRAILTAGQLAMEETGGAFHLFLGEVTRLWDIGGKNAKIPPEAELSAAREKYSAAGILEDGGRVCISNGALINLGGIAKGYAAERAMEIFEDAGVSCALISLGGNICAKGARADGTPWKIGVRDPRKTAADYLGILEVCDTVIAVSGGYERYSDIGGVRFCHIMDSLTAHPAESDIASVSVVCADGSRADALSTALFVMGREAALEFWRKSDGFECIIVDNDMRVTVSEGLRDSFSLSDGGYSLEIANR